MRYDLEYVQFKISKLNMYNLKNNWKLTSCGSVHCVLVLKKYKFQNIYHSLIASNKGYWPIHHSLVSTNFSILWIANIALLADHLHYIWINNRNVRLSSSNSFTLLWVRASALSLLQRQHLLINHNTSCNRVCQSTTYINHCMFSFICAWHGVFLFREVKVYPTPNLHTARSVVSR